MARGLGLGSGAHVADCGGSAVQRDRPAGSDLIADFSQSDIKRFWVLDVLNRALPELRHLHSIRQVHPEQLYRFLLSLSGALCTFSLDTRPTDFPLQIS